MEIIVALITAGAFVVGLVLGIAVGAFAERDNRVEAKIKKMDAHLYDAEKRLDLVEDFIVARKGENS